MPRNRNIYQNEALFVGPAPASGYSFIDVVGNLSNTGTYNLVFPLHRTQAVDYSIAPKYNDMQVLGLNTYLNRPQINAPDVNLSFEYLQYGILNELRLGFYANYTVPYGPDSGTPYYTDNFSVDVLGGFKETDLSLTEPNELHWPLKYRDRRNFYIATEREGYDVNDPESYYDVHPRAGNFTVAALGNCYITNYSAKGAVGAFPTVNVSYIGENVSFYSSGSGFRNPAVDSKSGYLVNDRIVSLPNFQSGSYLVPVLLPGDITVDINSAPCLTGINAVDGTGYDRGLYSQNSLFENLGIKYTDIKIQSYDLNLPLPRRELKSIGYKLPLNRVLDLPTTYTFGMNVIVGDSHTGDFTQFMKQNDDYNITVKLANAPKINPIYSGIAVRYDMIRAKLMDIKYSNRIGNVFKSCQMTFKGEKLYMSGIINTATVREEKGYLLLESSTPESPEYLLQEDGSSKIYWMYVPIPYY